MFAKEAEMTHPVASWMRARGLDVKAEFLTPWGICDLAGLSFDPSKVARRLQLRQTRSLTSITRAVLLLQIPDIQESRSVTLTKLVRQFAPSIPGNVIRTEMARLVADGFVVTSSHGRMQKLNGWMPLHDKLISVELKRARIDEAMDQALNNLGFADESYVALPTDVAQRVAANPSRWRPFLEAGVGVLAVAPKHCDVLLPARRTAVWTNPAVQLYCVEKFWRTRTKGS
jgi:hypothetical protein